MAEYWHHESFSAAESRDATSEASARPPAPFPVAIAHALNPLPQLFTTFPAPNLAYSVPLTRFHNNAASVLAGRVESADASREEAATGAATGPTASTQPNKSTHGEEDAWRDVEIDRLVEQMKVSASSLSHAGSFDHLLHEQLQRECGDVLTNAAATSPTARAIPKTEQEEVAPTLTAVMHSTAAVVHARAATAMWRLVRQSKQGTVLDHPAATSASRGGTGGGENARTTAATASSPIASGGTGAFLTARATTLGSGGALPSAYAAPRTRSGSGAAPASDEQWTRSPDTRMRLRPRHTSISSSQEEGTLDSAAGSRERSHSTTSCSDRPGRQTTVSKRARSEENATEKVTAMASSTSTSAATKIAAVKSSLEDVAPSQAADALDNPLVDLITPAALAKSDGPVRFSLTALRRLVQVLPMQSQPYRPFTQVDLTRFLSELLNDAAVRCAVTVPSSLPHTAGTTHKTSKTKNEAKREAKTEPPVKLEATDEADEGEGVGAASQAGSTADSLMGVAMQGLCSCVCAAHPTFPAEAAPEGLVDRALTALSVVMRGVTRALSEAALEVHEAAEAAREKATSASQPQSKARRSTGAGPAVTGPGSAHQTLIAWLEVLRAYLTHLAIVVCRPTIRLASDADLVRLEDVCVQTLFVVPHRCEKAMFHTYASYVMDGAAQLFQCVWNHLEVQRSSLAEAFFARIPLSDALRVRALVGPTGTKVMPLTVAVLAAAQSLPRLHEAESAEGVVQRQQQQCHRWANLILQQLLVVHMGDPKTEVDVALAVTVQMAEDLTELLACPEWPAADPLLRVLVLGLAHACFNANHAGANGVGVDQTTEGTSAAAVTAATPSPSSSAVADWLRPLAVDVVAHVALKLYDSEGPFRTVHRVANSYLLRVSQANGASAEGLPRRAPTALEAMAANLIEEANVEENFFSDWVRALNTTTTANAMNGATAGGNGKTKDNAKKTKPARSAPSHRSRRTHTAAHKDPQSGEENEEEEEHEEMEETHNTAHAGGAAQTPKPRLRVDLTAMEQLQALAYYAYNRHIEPPRHTRPDVASRWWHARAAQLVSWQHLCQNQPSDLGVSESTLHMLLVADSPSHAGLALNPTQFRWWLLVLSAGLDRSMTSRRMAQTLLSLLLSVFHVKDARGHELEVSDAVVKKALVSLSSLTALYPPLHRIIWQMARQCVQDSSARVRESMVPLLLSVLTTVLVQNSRHAHTRTRGTDATLSLPNDVMDLVADVVSSLLHLLEDRSVTVVSRTIGALEVILTEPAYRALLATPKGAVLLAFAEFKLLALVSGGAEKKHTVEVTRLFMRRWLLVLPEREETATLAASAASPHAQLAKELVALTTRCTPEFPHELPASAPIVLLLSAMAQEVRAQAGSARRRTKHSVSEAQLQLVMRGTVRTLWSRHQAATTAEETVSTLATLHALARVGPEWFESLLDVLVHALDYPPETAARATGSSSASTSSCGTPAVRVASATQASELAGGTLLQVCAIWGTLLSASRVPTISFDRLARAMTVLLSKYVGPYQQRIILAACGALTAMITCGSTDKLAPHHVQRPYLLLCYTLMNTYYVRVRALLPSLSKEPQNIVYIQRFLFLLSEFLRLYPGWRHMDASVLSDDVVASTSGPSTSAMPNQLVKGEGICHNAYQLAQDVLAACQDDTTTRTRVAAIVLRVLASVCMLDPSEYLYKCSAQLTLALEPTADPALQAQGLTLIRDFLGEEDARVEMAAQQTTCAAAGRRRAQTAASHAAGTHGEDASTAAAVAAALDAHADEEDEFDEEEEEAEPPVGTRGRGATGKSRTRARLHTRQVRDQNSGMATWVLQRFHESVLELCGSPHVHIRALCLDVLDWTAQGGLLPPVKYLDALVALSADSVSAISQRARRCLQAHADRHEDAIAAHATQGVLRAYQLHHACRLHLLRSALLSRDAVNIATSATGPAAGLDVSVHGTLFGLLRKRHRDTFLISLLRFFYQESKARAWCLQYGPVEPHVSQAAPAQHPDTAFHIRSFVSLLGHLAVAVVLLPFSSEGDVVQVLHQCRTGIDLVGQSALDAVSSILGQSPVGDDVLDDESDRHTRADARVLGLWKALGVTALHAMRQALTSEYRLTFQKLQRYALNAASNGGGGGTGHHAPALPSRRDGGPGMAQFLTTISDLVRIVTPCATWMAAQTETPSLEVPDGVLDGLRFLQHALETALLATTEELLVPAGSTAARRGAGGRAKRGRAAPPSAKKTKGKTAAMRTHKHRRREHSEDTSDDVLSDEEEPEFDEGDHDEEVVQTSSNSDGDDGDDDDSTAASLD